MRIAVKIPHGYEEKFNKLTDIQREMLKVKCMEKIAEELK